MKRKHIKFLAPVLIVLVAAVCIILPGKPNNTIPFGEIPVFSNEPYAIINDNQPLFTQEDLTTNAYEFYSPLDTLGRCGYAMACIGKEIMPQEDRGTIGQIKPSGWHTVKYDCVDGKYLYNRCHLIGYQLTGENANECNLITGTRYLNVEGMLPFENKVADYIQQTGNHVLYRVTPVFVDNNLLASGLYIEAMSVEDNGNGICFCVYIFNYQPGIAIDYATGESALSENQLQPQETLVTIQFVLNLNSKKFHDISCRQGEEIKTENKEIFTGSREELINQGYSPAGCCDP